MNFAKGIRVARALADMSQGTLADKSEIDRSYLSLIESGKRKPSIEIIEKIARSLDLPMHLLVLLASEKSDVRGVSTDDVQTLSIELTKLLLGSGNDEGGQSDHTGASVKKPSRSRISTGHPTRKVAATR